MGAPDLLAALRRKPFEPFRIVTSDGVNYDVRHPDLVMVSMTGAIVGFPDPNVSGALERYDIIGLEHIVRLEQLLQTAPAKPNGK